jgi:hypothetical protein
MSQEISRVVALNSDLVAYLGVLYVAQQVNSREEIVGVATADF